MPMPSESRDMRTSDIRIECRTSDSGREFAAAIFPSGRIVLHRPETLVFYTTVDRCPVPRDGPEKPENTRTGIMYRKADQTGISGTGVVADFVRFSDGSVVQEWRNEGNPNLETPDGVQSSGLDFRPTLQIAVQIHGHNGRTEYVFDNGEVAYAR